MMLQQPQPDDYVLATGDSHTVREFVERAFAVIGRRIEWRGEGADEIGVDKASGKVLIKVDPRYFRPTEVVDLLPAMPRRRAPSSAGSIGSISMPWWSKWSTSDLAAARAGKPGLDRAGDCHAIAPTARNHKRQDEHDRPNVGRSEGQVVHRRC